MRTYMMLTAVVATGMVLSPIASSAASAGPGLADIGQRAADSGGPGKKALKKANKWAKKDNVKEARTCRSGNNYKLKQDSYYGAYGLAKRAWRKNGGRQFAKRADKATKTEQNYVARRVARTSGLGAIGCDTSDWMQRVYSTAPKTPLSQMLIPGTHDSGTKNIRTQDPCSTVFVDGSQAFAGVSSQNPCVFAALFQAQDLTLEEQLQRGVRYLDLRVGVPSDQVLTTPPASNAADPTQVPLVLSHQLVAEPLIDGLAGVQRFIKSHPEEQVILDFQELNLPQNPAIAAYYKNALDRLLRTYTPSGSTKPICTTAWASDVITVPDNSLGTAVPIKQAWRKGVSNIVYFKSEDKPSADPCYRNRWAGSSFLYPNTDDPTKSTRDNLGYLQDRKQRIATGNCTDARGDYYCGINVSQLQLTPTVQTYVACVQTPASNCSLEYYAGLVNDNVADNVRKWRFGKDLPVNIAMVDYIERSKPSIPDRLIAYNWRVADGA